MHGFGGFAGVGSQSSLGHLKAILCLYEQQLMGAQRPEAIGMFCESSLRELLWIGRSLIVDLKNSCRHILHGGLRVDLVKGVLWFRPCLTDPECYFTDQDANADSR